MEFLKNLITEHAAFAHWYIFGAVILAGFNIPISIDILVLLAALIAATLVPENTAWLFGAVLIGCYLSAMCAYWVGRFLGKTLSTSKFFSKFMPSSRLLAIKKFYEKYGMWTLIFGRFIPFGVRNCIFMSSGMSKVPFGKFILTDALACSVWCSAYFSLFFILGKNYETLWHHLKTFNLCIFSAFGVAVIGFIWYKLKKKRKPSKDLSPD